jgi:hypothetical protein
MTKLLDIKSFYAVSNDVIAKKIEDEYVIVPVIAGIGDLDSEIYSLNRTGSILWEELDGKKSLEEVVLILSQKFNMSKDEIIQDVIEIVLELMKKGFVHEKKP